eukprot:TRINITY_DN7131_c0_g1_i1.p1 TRINITY_DN7131_c0_g1~~TRINITY_DN7131_c0_g1_i1.p1  ORF type:complete len:461 (+),score=161.41 TRINITY_DN7131_c0_g1_i1:75-1385(+)
MPAPKKRKAGASPPAQAQAAGPAQQGSPSAAQQPARSPPTGTEAFEPEEQLKEQQSYMRIVEAFRYYRESSMGIMRRRKGHFDALHPKYKEMLGDHAPTFERWEKCVVANAEFLEAIAQASDRLFSCYFPQGKIRELQEAPTPLDIDKVFSTLKQFVRDWGAEGLQERESAYRPIYEALEQHWPDRAARHAVRVLVPGTGLSRLAFEISLRGFFTQGNEFSHHMLVSGHFLLNQLKRRECVTVHPFVDQTVNVYDREEQFRPILIPDLCPMEAVNELQAQGLQQGEFSMVAGDFLEVYNKPEEEGTWDCVASCFFVDTAHNIFEYVETFHRILKKGGLWVNLGPLLYHFSDDLSEQSVDLAFNELRHVVQAFGFRITEERRQLCTYTANEASMKGTVYNCVYFTAIKEGDPQIPMASVNAVQNPHGGEMPAADYEG